MEDAKKSRPGRPRKYDSPVRLSVNMPAELRARLVSGAAAAGVSLSAHVVSILRGAL